VNVWLPIFTVDPISVSVTPPIVTTDVGAVPGPKVVPARPIPPGPTEIVCPPITVVRGTDSGLKVNVEPPMIASEEPEPAVVNTIFEGFGGDVGSRAGWTVVLPIPIPPGPMEIVFPLTTVVVGLAPGPIL
jgi:hypothetical protein